MARQTLDRTAFHKFLTRLAPDKPEIIAHFTKGGGFKSLAEKYGVPVSTMIDATAVMEIDAKALKAPKTLKPIDAIAIVVARLAKAAGVDYSEILSLLPPEPQQPAEQEQAPVTQPLPLGS